MVPIATHPLPPFCPPALTTRLVPPFLLQKDVGAFNYIQMDEGLEAMCLALYTRYLKWSREQTLIFLPEVRKSLNDPKIHSMYRL